jgi:hypothetical protein
VQTCASRPALDLEIHRHEGRVVDRDADLFDRRDKEIFPPSLLQDRREQLYQLEPPIGVPR